MDWLDLAAFGQIWPVVLARARGGEGKGARAKGKERGVSGSAKYSKDAKGGWARRRAADGDRRAARDPQNGKIGPKSVRFSIRSLLEAVVDEWRWSAIGYRPPGFQKSVQNKSKTDRNRTGLGAGNWRAFSAAPLCTLVWARALAVGRRGKGQGPSESSGKFKVQGSGLEGIRRAA
jgi:hypothetical protein